MANSALASSDPAVRALARELVNVQRELETLKRAGRTTQLQSASVMGGGSIPFYDGDGLLRMVMGQNGDGGYSIKTLPPPQPPPRPNTPILTPFPSGIGVTWNGEFITGQTPSDFLHIEVYQGNSPTFIASRDNFIGTMRAAGSIPDAPLATGNTYYYLFIACNTAEKPENFGTGPRATASEPSLTNSAQPALTVAQEILDGIVTDTKIAADAVGKAQIKVKAIDGTKIEENSISSPLIIAESILANHIALNQILADHMTADSVTAREIRALSILGEHLTANLIEAGHIKAGSITANKLEADLVIAKRLLAGDPIGARIELHPTLGLQAFTAAGLRTIWIDSATGNVDILGSFQSGTGADRIVVQPGQDFVPSIFFYALADPVKPAYMNAINLGGRNALGLNSGPNVDSGTSPYQGTLLLQHDLVRLFINTAPGNSRGNNQGAGGYLGLTPTMAELSASTQSTGALTSQFLAQSNIIWMRTIRTSGNAFASFDLFQNDINCQIFTSDGASRDGGYFWLRRGTGGDTYIGKAAGTQDNFLRFGNDTAELFGPGDCKLTMIPVSGEVILGSGGNNYIRFTNSSAQLVQNGTVKSFVIPHPDPTLTDSHFLVHGCTESPNGGVEYWGETFISQYDSTVEVELPDYFEHLCSEDDRNIQLTQILGKYDPVRLIQLAASRIEDGRFTIVASDPGPVWINWVVKAKRRDIDFEVEPHQSTVRVDGNGPYAWVTPV